MGFCPGFTTTGVEKHSWNSTGLFQGVLGRDGVGGVRNR